MSLDYQQDLDSIHDLLSGNAEGREKEVLEVAGKYANVCTYANKRLRAAYERLQNGYRSEAIQICEEVPNLLELVSLLDFPDLDEWKRLVTSLNVSPSPALLIDVAAELNDAYASELPLQALLRSHRLLALGRAPLVDRITVLRRVASKDPENEFWNADISDLETARMKQIRESFVQLEAADDERQLHSIVQELRTDNWRVSPSESLRRDLRGALDRVVAKRSAATLQEIEPQLSKAHAALDLDEGRQLRETWKTHADAARLPADHSLIERVGPALDWLDAEDAAHGNRKKYSAAIQSLERALDDYEPRENIEQSYVVASRFDEAVPDVLNARYRERLAQFDLRARRLHRLTILGAMGGIAIIIVTVVTLTTHLSHRAAVRTASQQLTHLIEIDRLEAAYQFLQDLDAGVINHPTIQSASIDLEDRMSKERSRREEFEAAVARVREHGFESPDYDTLKEAKKLAKTQNEQNVVDELQENVSATLTRQSNRQADKFYSELKMLGDRVRKYENENRFDSKIALAFINDVDDLTSQHKNLGPFVLDQAKPLRSRLVALERMQHQLKELASLRSSVTQQVGEFNQFMRALQELSQIVSSSKSAENIDAVVSREADVWQAMASWEEILDDPLCADLRSLTPTTATTFGDKLRRSKDQIAGKIVLPSDLDERLSMLDHLGARKAEDGRPIVRRLEAITTSPLLKDLWFVRHPREDGARYYMSSEPQVLPDQKVKELKFQYFTSFNLATRSKRLPADSYRARAPQSVFIDQLDGSLMKIRGAGVDGKGVWETQFVRLVKSLSQNRDLDEILKIILMKQILAVASEGSYPISVAYKEHLDILNAAPVDVTANWLLPDDRQTESARSAATEALASLPPLAEAQETAVVVYRSITAAFQDRFRWVGWIGRDDRGQLVPLLKDNEVDGRLFVISLSSGDQPPGKRKYVAKAYGGTATWSDASDRDIVEGRPLYLAVE